MSAPRTSFAHIVIAGAGPAGLCAAIYLAQRGVKLTLVDPRAGEYTRAGDWTPSAFEALSHLLKIYVESSYANHIKDAESFMYAQIQKDYLTQVSIVKAAVTGFEPGPSIRVGEGEAALVLPCDLYLDCSGLAKIGIKAVNRIDPKQPYFKTEAILEQKTATLMVRAKMARSQFKNFTNQATSYISWKLGGHLAVAVEKFRALGWERYDLPRAYGNRLDPQLQEEGGFFAKPAKPKVPQSWSSFFSSLFQEPKFKGNFYLDAPKNLAPEHYQAWADELGKIYTGDANFAFELIQTSNPDKKTLSFSNTEPVLVTPAAYLGSESMPVVIHLGDATVNFPAKLARGMTFSVDRMNILFEMMTFKEGKVELDLPGYMHKAAQSIDDHREYLARVHASQLRYYPEPDYKSLVELYEQALKSCSKSEQGILERGLEELKGRLDAEPKNPNAP